MLIAVIAVNAQVSQGGMLSATSVERTTSNYYFAKPNELTIIVSVVGFVQRPGRYEISSTIDLINLMALAGGATADGAMNDVKITRISENEGRIRMREFHLNLEEISRLTGAELRLQPGDIIQVDKSGWSGFRDTFTVVVGAAIITGAVAQVIYATKR
jgi:protein involved in polysaccharide export with SLBB domain